MKDFFIISFLVIFSAVNGQNNLVDKTKIAILPYKSDYDFIFKDCRKSKLTEEEFKKLEIILKKCIDKHNVKAEKEYNKICLKHPNDKPDRNHFIIEIERYKRQYIVVINSNDEKEVWVNCLCYLDNKKWKKEPIGTKDGGNCYFRLKINLTKEEYYDFSVNGDA